MAFPEIYVCLIAEDARIELYNKVTILGLYGIAPHVEIIIKDLTKPIRPFTFILLGGSTEGGNYQIKPRIIPEKGEELLKATPKEIGIPTKKGHNLILHLPQIQFPIRGKYTFALDVNGKQHFETTFHVRPADPGEL